MQTRKTLIFGNSVLRLIQYCAKKWPRCNSLVPTTLYRSRSYSPQRSHVGWDIKPQMRERKLYDLRAPSQCFFLFVFFFFFLFFHTCHPFSNRFSWGRRGGRTRTSSAPGPASSSAAGRAPPCSACWVESESATARCERWRKAAGPERERRGEEKRRDKSKRKHK